MNSWRYDREVIKPELCLLSETQKIYKVWS